MTSPYEGMKAVLYARVSTEDHHEDVSKNRQDPESQLLALSKFCKENGIDR
ncbi:MAG: recombinase family protein [Candidatus Cloacimonetes bacterium]|nr:recombinase family protein [Candidatus Cloacimonadota bacterium]